MTPEIDVRHHWAAGGADRTSERLLVAPFEIVDRRQVGPGAARAYHPRRVLQARVERLRVGRLTQIEAAGADLSGNGDDMVFGCNTTDKERACGDGAKHGPGAYGGCL